MSDPLLLLLRLCLLALIYLTFFRVIRAVTVELRAENRSTALAPRPPVRPAPRPTSPATAPADVRPAGSSGAEPSGETNGRVTTVIVIDSDGMAGEPQPLTGELIVGRAESCGLSLTDSMVSKFHARLTTQTDGTWLEDLGSTNGTGLNGHPLDQPQMVHPGDRVQVGGCTLELR